MCEIKPYRHTVQYYETDGMRIVHHSNYIRWMEEARCDFLVQKGFDIMSMEKRGIMMPVLAVDCRYIASAVCGDVVKITLQLDWFNGLKYQVSYRFTNEDETITYLTGTTEHCFLNDKLRPTVIKRTAPDIFEAFYNQAVEIRKPLK